MRLLTSPSKADAANHTIPSTFSNFLLVFLPHLRIIKQEEKTKFFLLALLHKKSMIFYEGSMKKLLHKNLWFFCEGSMKKLLQRIHS